MEAKEVGLLLPRQEYAAIFALGERKRELIEQLNPGPNTPAVFSWEAWGRIPDPQLVDEEGGVGNSGAATAAWLQAAGRNPALLEARRRAEAYLRRAAMATPYQIPGVMPTAWPMELFERSFVLHALLMGDLLKHEELANVVQPQVAELFRATLPRGIGFSRNILPDGDDTAAALAVLAACGCAVSPAILAPFEHEAHFSTYPFELHASPVVTAKAAHALRSCGFDATRWQDAVVSEQHGDGLWDSDKWNMSRFYGTSIALMALRGASYTAPQQRCQRTLIATQRRGGAWGSSAKPTCVETAFAVLGLYSLARDNLLDSGAWNALWRGQQMLLAQWETGVPDNRVWVCKELYSPRRVDRAYVLTAILAPHFLAQSSLPTKNMSVQTYAQQLQ